MSDKELNPLDTKGYVVGCFGGSFAGLLVSLPIPSMGAVRELLYGFLVSVICGLITGHYRPLPWRKK